MMIQNIMIQENKPFPNSTLPVLYYPKGIADKLNEAEVSQKVLSFFEQNGYTNGWVGSIYIYHHFHSNTHEVLGCISGEAQVQLGGPNAEIYPFRSGNVLLLPAGVAHKLITASEDFQIVGAYPDHQSPDMQTGNLEDYSEVTERIQRVSKPKYDPVQNVHGGVAEYWKE